MPTPRFLPTRKMAVGFPLSSSGGCATAAHRRLRKQFVDLWQLIAGFVVVSFDEETQSNDHAGDEDRYPSAFGEFFNQQDWRECWR